MHRLCPTTKTTCHLELHPVSAVPEPAHASYNSGIPLRCYTSLPCVAPTSDASSVHATNCNQSTECLYLLATRSCKACSKRPDHATTMCRACLHARIASKPIPYQQGSTELSQQRSEALRGSVPAKSPPEPSRSRPRGHPGTMPQHPTCIDADMGHMEHPSIQAYQ